MPSLSEMNAPPDMCCRKRLGSTSQAIWQLSCLGIAPVWLPGQAQGLRWSSSLSTFHMLRAIHNVMSHLVPTGNLPTRSKARPAKCTSCPCHFGIEGKSWRQKPLTNPLQELCHPFSLKISHLFSVAPQSFRKVASSRESSLSSLWCSQSVSIHNTNFQTLRVTSHLLC